jgi:DNA-directed RNA polymerase alpha subunit
MTQPNIFISCKESRIENNKSFYGCFYLGPFDSGQSLTIANALRRTLLSECTGLGIVSVSIDHVNHEYSTIPGVRESVLDLLLNLKEVVLRKKSKNYALLKAKKNSTLYNQVGVSYFKPVSGFLKVKGPGVIRAKDLKLPTFVECVDPEQYIATLADDGFLCMKFIIMEGKGYLVPQLNPLFAVPTFPKAKAKEAKTQQTRVQGKDKQGQGKEEAQIKIERSNFMLSSSTEQQIMPQQKLTTSSSNSKRKDEDKGLDFDENNTQSVDFFDTSDFIKKRLNFIHEIQKFQLLQQQLLAKGAKAQVPLPGAQKQSKQEKQDYTPLYAEATTKQKNFIGFDTYLNLDTVFNPVTKVSYIIEDFDNKIMEDSNQKINFVDDVCDLLDSSYYLKQNFPSLIGFCSPLGSRKSTEDSMKTRENFFKFIDTYSTSDIQDLSHYLHPLKKQNSKQNIILEIWTNGSLHPRDALYTAFEKLSSVFLNIQKTQTYNSMYSNESSLLIASLNIPNNRFLHDQASMNHTPLLQNQNQDEKTQMNPLTFAPLTPLGTGSKEKVDQNIESLNLSLRPYTLLKRANIHTFSDLCLLTSNELKSICGFNTKYNTHILNVMTQNGLSLKK